MIYQCSNNRQLVVAGKDHVYAALPKGVVPSVVLLTAWIADDALPESLGRLVRFLIDKGCTHIVCAGVYSEALHDAIDDCLYEYDDETGVEKSREIVTTYHPNESIEDVVNFFVHSTDIKDKDNGYLLAILDVGAALDAEILCCLMLEAKKGEQA